MFNIKKRVMELLNIPIKKNENLVKGPNIMTEKYTKPCVEKNWLLIYFVIFSLLLFTFICKANYLYTHHSHQSTFIMLD